MTNNKKLIAIKIHFRVYGNDILRELEEFPYKSKILYPYRVNINIYIKDPFEEFYLEKDKEKRMVTCHDIPYDIDDVAREIYKIQYKEQIPHLFLGLFCGVSPNVLKSMVNSEPIETSSIFNNWKDSKSIKICYPNTSLTCVHPSIERHEMIESDPAINYILGLNNICHIVKYIDISDIFQRVLCKSDLSVFVEATDEEQLEIKKFFSNYASFLYEPR